MSNRYRTFLIHNHIQIGSIGSKVMAVLLNRWILPVEEVQLGKVCAHPAKQACLRNTYGWKSCDTNPTCISHSNWSFQVCCSILGPRASGEDNWEKGSQQILYSSAMGSKQPLSFDIPKTGNSATTAHKGKQYVIELLFQLVLKYWNCIFQIICLLKGAF